MFDWNSSIFGGMLQVNFNVFEWMSRCLAMYWNMLKESRIVRSPAQGGSRRPRFVAWVGGASNSISNPHPNT
ncbi:hypothetical protein SF83666_c24810 [Sinorhizobium fredii CCBAU 83666]|nr:hypothetical protein SF83666_c24810 [Sinorhizobium fredii CCBAU 83666]